MHRLLLAAAAIALAGCVTTPSTLVPPEKRALGVPALETARHAVPLRVAVHVPLRVLNIRSYFERQQEPRWLVSRVIGPDVLAAVVETFPKVFDDVYMTPRFPSPQIDAARFDAVVVVESVIAVWASDAIAMSSINQDVEVTLGVYSLDGQRIAGVTTVGSDTFTWKSDMMDSSGRITEGEANAGYGVPAAMRRALMQLPASEIMSQLIARQDGVRARMAAPADEAYWNERRSAFEAQVAKQHERLPVNVTLGEPFHRGLLRQANLVAGIAGAIGGAALAQMPVQSGGQMLARQATMAYVDIVLKDNALYQGLRPAADAGMQLIAIGGVRAQGAGARAAVPDLCTRLGEVVQRCAELSGALAPGQGAGPCQAQPLEIARSVCPGR